jgi:lipid-A-disaccharide synthase
MSKSIQKVYLIAGEASGDLHASNLIRSMKTLSSGIDFRVWGGDHCQEAGAKVVKHIKDLAFMGFVEVIANLGTILKNIRFCKQDILTYKPDVLILVDYPGFNLRIAEWAKGQGIRVVYYISPQIWAWKESRVHKIKKIVDQLLVILPFEKDFYAKHDFPVEFVGHPLLDVVQDFVPEKEIKKGSKPLVALLPGSRGMEIKQVWPIMAETVKACPQYDFVLAMAPTLSETQFHGLSSLGNVQVVKGQTYAVLNQADAALVTSGTATLETALFGVPEVVCYKGNAISYHIAKYLIKVKYISLVNLILDRSLVTELIQSELTSANLSQALQALFEPKNKTKLVKGYNDLKLALGETGASMRAARAILEK